MLPPPPSGPGRARPPQALGGTAAGQVSAVWLLLALAPWRLISPVGERKAPRFSGDLSTQKKRLWLVTFWAAWWKLLTCSLEWLEGSFWIPCAQWFLQPGLEAGWVWMRPNLGTWTLVLKLGGAKGTIQEREDVCEWLGKLKLTKGTAVFAYFS